MKEASYTRQIVKFNGYTIVTYTYGQGDEVLLCLNGGPGLPCDYLRDVHTIFAKYDIKVVAYDQLGCGESDKPKEKSLWTIARYVRELEAVRCALNIERMHLLGHSWGGWLAIEYALTHGQYIKSLILENTCADIPHLSQELARLRASLGAETVQMMIRHEAEGTFDHPEYQAALTLLTYRHVCRLQNWPESLNRSLDQWNWDVYNTMQGPNEFLFTGNLKNWNRLDDMHNLAMPTLITVGLHDELPPSCAMRMEQVMPNAKIHVFNNSSHTPFYEEPNAYQSVLLQFLQQ